MEDARQAFDAAPADASILRRVLIAFLSDESHEFAQRQSPRGGLRGRQLERVGNPGYAGSAPGLLA
jgi:hypothetical protein